MEWEPIEDHALVGDCRSAALVGRDGSIDWLCWPRFDSPALFASLLDPERGGRFRIGPVDPARTRRRYLPGSNVLETVFSTEAGEVRLVDLFPVADEETKRRVPLPDHELARLATCTRGELELDVEFDARSGYGAGGPIRYQLLPWGLRAEERRGTLLLQGSRGLDDLAERRRTRARLRAGESLAFRLSWHQEAPAAIAPLEELPEAIARSEAWWRGWSSRLRYDGPWRDAVVRSALALRLLVYAPSGAVIAAPTASLPEEPGAEKNWDYRFCWLRDASFIVRALVGLGCPAEAEAFVSWLLHSTRLTRPRLGVLYDVFGEMAPRERSLPLRGYRDSRPVRIGNDAIEQKQLDLYGEVIDAAAIYLRDDGAIDRETERMLLGLGRYVLGHWQDPDEGIWEVRTQATPHTHSLVLCWVALDRLVELAERGTLRRAPVDRYREAAERIRATVRARCWSEALGSYVAVPGGDAVDAALLLLAWYRFEPAASPRMDATWRRVREQLGDGPLLRRYRNLGGEREGAFGICSFWEVDFLARAGRLDEARALFEVLLGYANDVGLYAEEIDPRSGAALGNFPQGLTHVGLINAALSIEAAQRRGEGREAP